MNNAWEKLDSLDFDIANFYNKTETDTLLAGKVDNTDSRLTDSRTPKSHTHGNITNTGAVGSTANKPLITTKVSDYKEVEDGRGYTTTKDTKDIYEKMKLFIEKGYKISNVFDSKKYNEEIYKKIERLIEGNN